MNACGNKLTIKLMRYATYSIQYILKEEYYIR